jgi:hypothetical protein
VEEGVPGLVKRVGYRPTGSPKARKPPFGGTNPSTRKHKTKGELKHNRKQKYWTIGQNFKQTKKQHKKTKLDRCQPKALMILGRP